MTTKERVWEELFNTKSYILGIEQYTHNKRRNNRIIRNILIIVSGVCAITSIFPGCRSVTIASSFLVAIITILKEFMPIYGQSEEELCKLDQISNFFKSHLDDVINFFNSYYYSYRSSRVYDEKEIEDFENKLKTAGDYGTEMSRLCRNHYWKSEKIKEETMTYLNQIFREVETKLSTWYTPPRK